MAWELAGTDAQNQKMLELVRETGEHLFLQYAERGMNLANLAWAQYGQPNLRIIMQSETPATLDAFRGLLKANQWFDKWVIDRGNDDKEFRTNKANKAFIETNASLSFEAFRRALVVACNNYNATARLSAKNTLLEPAEIYTSSNTGSIHAGNNGCFFEFTGLNPTDSTKIKIKYVGITADKIDFQPTISDGQIVWQAEGAIETPESLAHKCVQSIAAEVLPVQQSSISIPQLKGLAFEKLLSFGSPAPSLTLDSLNILIGTNGSGKSNLFEVFRLLCSLKSTKESGYLSRSGGPVEWLWKGSLDKDKTVASARIVVDAGEPIAYEIAFTVNSKGQFEIVKESVTRISQSTGLLSNEKITFFERANGNANLSDTNISNEFDFRRSVLSQFSDPSRYPQLAVVRRFLDSVRFYRTTGNGVSSPLDHLQKADLPNDVLSESFDNLAVVLERILSDEDVANTFNSYLQKFYENAEGLKLVTTGGRIDIFLKEPNWTIPLIRLSDGTIKWICLLAILLDPDGSGIVFLEEPEIGLHPDILPSLAKLLIEASTNMQVVVTTHSDVLVDFFTETPQYVIVCEKEQTATAWRRLSPPDLNIWLDEYRLGEIWRSGKIGGTRW